MKYKILPEGVNFWDADTEALLVAFEMDADCFHDGGIIKYAGKLWHASSATCKEPPEIDCIYLREHKDCQEVSTEDTEDLDYEDGVICPFCKSKTSDSWELSDSEDEHECGCCGGVFAFERSVSVSYSMKPVKHPPVYEIAEGGGK